MRSLLFLLATAACGLAGWRVALPGWKYEFPRDHGNHPEFKTEWWYFTGNLATREGREFGYQLTFFRQGILSGDEDVIPLSRFVTRDVKLAHFAVSDLAAGKFHSAQKLSRGAYGEAGFDQGRRLAWIEGWTCERMENDVWRLRAEHDGVSLDLSLRALKPPVIHGRNGVSQKAEGEGRASHYYSLTRLAAEGTLRAGGEEFSVSGFSWFDHEWATNQLAAGQAGWDWLSLQCDDGSELMLFQLRTKDGGPDVHSGGTFVDAQGVAVRIGSADFEMQPGGTWTSPETKARYPVAWQISVPRLALRLQVRAARENQEMNFQPVTYWEGAIRAEGTRESRPIKGSGYLEMTGYAGAVAELQAK